MLTLLGGRVVYDTGDFAGLASPLPPAMPDWSPVRRHGGYQPRPGRMARCCDTACGVHGHDHARTWAADVPAGSDRGFWGALGCACWAF
ncbi:hypothetical protein [Falsiroseomonas tokyonensis]|uniref:Amidohydrolase n=1 Tax=Falsiroseomonas tokyonensis TaxID=430521 RepID=A0ABV7BQ41_9PROT|nr:hypothetical protein [Falsiroseomonas tokyonensis]